MSTWHQDRRPVRLFHETKWTVVDDPPNNLRTLMLFDTESDAREYCARMQSKGRHTYVLEPASKYR